MLDLESIAIFHCKLTRPPLITDCIIFISSNCSFTSLQTEEAAKKALALDGSDMYVNLNMLHYSLLLNSLARKTFSRYAYSQVILLSSQGWPIPENSTLQENSHCQVTTLFSSSHRGLQQNIYWKLIMGYHRR